MSHNSKTALVLLFDGVEEIEALTPIDLLSRAGVQVTQATLNSQPTVLGRSDICVQVDHTFEAIKENEYDAIILPGGPGTANLRNHPALCKKLTTQFESKRLVAGICAAPLIFSDASLLNQINFTAHPSTHAALNIKTEKDLVVDRNLITASGAGNAVEFSLAVVSALTSPEVAQKIATDICWNPL